MIPMAPRSTPGKSKTLDDIGLYRELVESGPLRRRPAAHDGDGSRRRRGARSASSWPRRTSCSAAWPRSPQDGPLVAASATGSQLAPYAAGAGRLILVVGSQKIVPDLPPPCAASRGRLPLRGRPGARASRRPHQAREGAAHLRRVDAGSDHGRARARAGRRLTEWPPADTDRIRQWPDRASRRHPSS